MCIRDRKWGVTPRRVNYYCAGGRIPGAVKMAGVWLIPKAAEKPVSYTHLDVYKRQRHRSRRAPPRRPGAKRTSTRKHRQKRSTPGKSWERPGRNWTRPVSYTHLDVYKRQ